VRAQANPDGRSCGPNFVDVSVAGIKEVLLSQMAKICANVQRNIKMIVDHQSHAGITGDWEDFPRHLCNSGGSRGFRAQLNDVCASKAKLSRHDRRLSAPQVGGVHESIQQALI
jgi:hypothetical protein